MIDWRLGGLTGSLNKWVRREVREQLRTNPIARRSRYGTFQRMLRRFFSITSFGQFVVAYLAVNLFFLLLEEILAWLAPDWLATWMSPSSLDLKALLLNVASYFITAQVGALGVISLALALVTLIAQRESSSSDIQVYYHESFAFEVVASCIALLAVLCAQLLWPTQFLLHRLGYGSALPVFKFMLLGVHLLWLLLNLAGLAHFIATTFGFVQQSERERLRERYTANVVYPRNITDRLRQQLYGMARTEMIGESKDSRAPSVIFGFDYGDPQTVEIQSIFDKPTALYDVRMVWVRWVLQRWAKRCTSGEDEDSAARGTVVQGPLLWFTPHIDGPLRGTVGWCRRRDGLPLGWFEKFVLRRAFRFRRTGSDA